MPDKKAVLRCEIAICRASLFIFGRSLYVTALSCKCQSQAFGPYLKMSLAIILRNFENNKIFFLYRFGPAMKLVNQLHGENANLCPDKLISKCQKSTVKMEMKCHILTVKRLKKFK